MTVNLNRLTLYAPTLDVAEEPKYSLYDVLQDAVDSVPTGCMLIVTGDWNARAGAVDGSMKTGP